ncbi:MAG: formylmethanofuran dehydrogenase subunit C [Candidatus Bathyarchaeota archaeon]|nr:MAG: formylmethanofuran dehydrogenase subunit C [Candidatus Bathyarchaeota archaeon]
MITLYPKRLFKAPVDAQCITPDIFAEKTVSEIAELRIWEGNQRRTLDQLFRIDYDAKNPSEEMTIRIFGDVRKVRRIGTKMSTGRIIIDGDTGMHLGEEMQGGTIVVAGSAGSWTGCMMEKGIIQIKGDAGDYIGAAYRGSTRGMNGGEIIIQGNAGNEVGCFMRSGLIRIDGRVGQFVGIHMRNGTIIVQGNSKERSGAQMRGGKIVVCGHTPSILPTFTVDSINPKVKINGENVKGPFYKFVGDLAENGNGKLFVSQNQNPHLKFYEKYLE